MIVLTKTPGTLNKFGRTAWKFQRTFKTPPQKNLSPFVTAIVGSINRLASATVTVDNLVLEPEHLLAILSQPTAHLQRDTSVSATGRVGVETLLKAALSDVADLLFVPTPRPFVIYADRNQRSTLFAMTRSNLALVGAELSKRGFTEIIGYRYASHPEALN